MKMNAEFLRFFGPVSKDRAEVIAELLLESDSFKESLIQLLTDEKTPRDFAYETQALAEVENEGLDENSEEGLAG